MKFDEYKPEIKTQENQKSIIDMDPVLKRVPPIEGVFSPNEEVEKLWSVPKTERKKAVALFRDKLARQREAWMLCRTSIEERIEFNPDLSKEEMTGIINEFASHYGFAKKDIEVAKSLVDDYTEMRKRVVEIRKEFPDDIALINRLTGLNFTEADAKDFKVSVGPISIEILCSGFNTGKIRRKLEGYADKEDEGNEEDREFEVAGFTSETSDEKPIYYLVVNKDYAITYPDFYVTTIPHEREHLKNKILAPKLYGIKIVTPEELGKNIRGSLRRQIGEKLLSKFTKNLMGLVFFLEHESTKNPEEKTFLLTEFMRLEREDALNKVKDDIIVLKATENYYNKQFNYNIFLEQDSGDYDYLADIRNRNKEEGNVLRQKIVQKVLVEEYGKIITNAINAFDKLRNNDYSSKEAIAILSDKRLSDWPKTVKRLLEEKTKRLLEEKK